MSDDDDSFAPPLPPGAFRLDVSEIRMAIALYLVNEGRLPAGTTFRCTFEYRMLNLSLAAARIEPLSQDAEG